METKSKFVWQTLKNWLPALCVMALIFYFSATPGNVINQVGLGSERIHINGHFMLFTVLCFAYYKGVKKVWLAMLLTVLYAVFDELHQIYTPMRAASLFDIYVDSFGALIAALILWKQQLLLSKTLKNWLNN